jgi:hypothetical protein
MRSTFDARAYRHAGKFLAFADGGYPLFYLCGDGGVLCAACATADGQTEDPHDPQWHLVAADVNWEGDPIPCDHCGEDIESAYGPVEN